MLKYEFTNATPPEQKSISPQDRLVDDPQLAEIMAYRTNEEEIELSALRLEVESQRTVREQHKPVPKEASSRLGKFVAKFFFEMEEPSSKEIRFNFIEGEAALKRIDAEVLYHMGADPDVEDETYKTWRDDHRAVYRPLKRKSGTAGVAYALAESFKEDDSLTLDRPAGMPSPDDNVKLEDLKQSAYFVSEHIKRDKVLLKTLKDGMSESDLASEITATHDNKSDGSRLH